MKILVGDCSIWTNNESRELTKEESMYILVKFLEDHREKLITKEKDKERTLCLK